MKILHVNDNDLIGRRFNGFDLIEPMRRRGHELTMCVWDKQSESASVWRLPGFRFRRLRWVRDATRHLEFFLSIQALLQPFGATLAFCKRFWTADVVHLHLIQNDFFSLLLLPLLSRLKPTVWTLHDPWALTHGHCVYPAECRRWKRICGHCPDLVAPIRMRKDHTRFMWRVKYWIYGFSRLEIVVASRWMESQVKTSPLLRRARVHYIPFGIDLARFNPDDNGEVRRALGIDPDASVIAFRSTENVFKGFDHVQRVLVRLAAQDRKICLLTFERKFLLRAFRDKFKIVDLGFVTNVEKAMRAADFFLMPSSQEAFGLMAIEAMATAKPVIVFDGTALPDTIKGSGQGGIVVPADDNDALLEATIRLLDHPDECRAMGERARKIVEEHYGEDKYIESLLELYRSLLPRRARTLREPAIARQ